jgi:aconitate hydratase
MKERRTYRDALHIIRELHTSSGTFRYYSLSELARALGWNISRLPVTLKILLESMVRNVDGKLITESDIERMGGWTEGAREEVPFMPARVIMQDFTGVPAIVDLAVMRDALAELGGNPERINPLIPVDLIIDHSVQVDQFASVKALAFNAEMEFRRNRERYEFLRWGAESFDNLKVVPPATGICHQVNLEYLAKVVQTAESKEGILAFPDTLLGTDSHTTMIDGVGVLGWGVGGIEAEAVILGQPYYMLVPDVIGFRLTGKLNPGTTPTDIVLRVTEQLREYGVVGKLVEFFGPGLHAMTVADRALVSNMSPETGATALFFPVDEQTLDYLKESGRPRELIELVEVYTREQGLFREAGGSEPRFTDVIELDLSSVEPSIAGPSRPQDRIPLSKAHQAVFAMLGKVKREQKKVHLNLDGRDIVLEDGSVVIAAITSCTNTSNPTVLIGAGLLAKKAVQLGLQVPSHVKTSLAPGSKVVTRYLEDAGLMPYLEALGFHVVGYGCTTCIGNSGPLRSEIGEAVRKNDLFAASVLSGNRNFEGRVHPDVRACFLMSPLLVVVYALAGTMNRDLTRDPIGIDRNGEEVFLSDIWPKESEVQEAIGASVSADLFTEEYADVYTGNEAWNKVKITKAKRYNWSEKSTYIRKPPFFDDMPAEPPPPVSIENGRVLVLLGDTVTTDHISPAGSIPAESPAGRWLIDNGVKQRDFNSFGSRRGNHEVMMRGTFGNIRIRNLLVPETEGGVTKLLPSGAVLPIYDAAIEYEKRGVPLVIIAGREYGTGSSRDWAAKGTLLLGVKAVIAESFERIHRSNLIGMGVLPLQFTDGESASSLGLTGLESYSVDMLEKPGQELNVRVADEKGKERSFTVKARVDTSVELEYYKNGGILHTVLRQMARH